MTTIGIAQMAGLGHRPAENLHRADVLAGRAADAGAALVCFPEQFTTGWSPHVPSGSGEGLEGPTVSALRRTARDHGIAVLGSFLEHTGGKPRNTAVAIDDAGTVVATYAKIHLFSPGGEDRSCTPGEETATFTVDGMTFGIAVCYDLRFPELFRIYADAGADCILVPSAWPCSRLRHFELFVTARALENQCYVLGINAAGGEEPDLPCGGSIAADPDGSIIARGDTNERLIFTELDRDRIRAARSRIPALKDRKSDLYHRLLVNK
ncbi:nitrilase [Methanoculleus sp. FWC-SCC1]|uniref:Nitrilase n=1 Tax=Methanoculleus frigidifontis TaxID=2584085 RepID=A0ABT8MBR1_9EURY|nr:nitrilase-related carbon-nitrogen hydrolase [Methanoculleus sp. FWC-SCC1]MDN7025376.1 nitrilase [Methanoculleus sp. FWC-SCC1]